MHMQRLALPICSSLCLGPLLAQADVDNPEVMRSMTSALPLAFSQHGTPLSVRFTDPGPDNTPNAPMTANDADHGDYAFASLLANYAAYDMSEFAFGSMSSGNDGIPPTINGVPNLTGRWLGINVSVSNDSGVVWPQFPVDPGNSQGSLTVSYFFEESVHFAEDYLGVAQLSRTGAEAGLPAGSDMDALDFGSALIQANPNIMLPVFAPNRRLWFFSVAHDWVYPAGAPTPDPALPPSFARDPASGTNFPPDPAVIYRTEWQFDGSSWGWSSPEIYLNRTALGLISDPNAPGYHEEAVDALMVQVYVEPPTEPDVVYFSTRKHAHDQGRNQLLALEPGGPTTLLDQPPSTTGQQNPSPTPVTDRIGTSQPTGSDADVDGACAIDPELAPNDASVALGVPGGYRYDQWFLPHMQQPMGMSIARRTTADITKQNGAFTSTELTFQFTGRGGSGNTGVCDLVLFAGSIDLTTMTPILSIEWHYDPLDPQVTVTLPVSGMGSAPLQFEAQLFDENDQLIAATPYLRIN